MSNNHDTTVVHILVLFVVSLLLPFLYLIVSCILSAKHIAIFII
jgi:hypothetical protein